MKRTLILCAVSALSGWHVYAQDEVRQAMITNRPGSPKCTIEVEVDVVADVEVRGTMARLHTLQGSPATWRRFECNQPMPMNPANFHFRGIDGRGRQTLIGDPMNSGVAVIRIEDPKAGREGYTFDLEWNGVAGPMPNGPGFPPPGPPIGGRDFGADEAIHRCGDAAMDQLHHNGYGDTRVLDAKIDDTGDRGDWISGRIAARRGPMQEEFGFACPVDFREHRIGAVNVRPAEDGYYGNDAGNNRFNRDRAIRACSEAVQDRLRQRGYDVFDIKRAELDPQGRDNGSIVGGLVARRGNFNDEFEFSCSIDLDDGRVRSVNVERHWH